MNKELRTGYYELNGEEREFNFSTEIDTADKVSFINIVMDTVVGNRYYPVLKDLIFDFAIIATFTDVDVSECKDIETIELLVKDTTIVNIVKGAMDEVLLQELTVAVNDSIAYETGIHRSDVTVALTGFVKSLEENLNVFQNQDIQDFIKKISSSTENLTPNTIVDAYFEKDRLQKK